LAALVFDMGFYLWSLTNLFDLRSRIGATFKATIAFIEKLFILFILIALRLAALNF